MRTITDPTLPRVMHHALLNACVECSTSNTMHYQIQRRTCTMPWPPRLRSRSSCHLPANSIGGSASVIWSKACTKHSSRLGVAGALCPLDPSKVEFESALVPEADVYMSVCALLKLVSCYVQLSQHELHSKVHHTPKACCRRVPLYIHVIRRRVHSAHHTNIS
jgi:hypothetical protein